MKIKKINGMTLVEILIVGLLGYIVSSTAIDFIFSSSNSTDNREIEGSLLQDGMLASSFIANDLYRSGDLDYGVSPFLKDPFDWDETGANTIENDEIALRFHNHSDYVNCAGNASAGQILKNHYLIEDESLVCSAIRTDGILSSVEIIDNAVRFNVVFGVDLTGDGVIDRFVDENTAKSVNDDVEQRVVAVRFGLLLAKESKSSSLITKTFNLVDGRTATYTDNKIYKYFERTILLRNML